MFNVFAACGATSISDCFLMHPSPYPCSAGKTKTWKDSSLPFQALIQNSGFVRTQEIQPLCLVFGLLSLTTGEAGDWMKWIP